MDRLFRIDFYPQEWIVQTMKMTPEQRGIFITICCLIYSNRGVIENDPAWIGKASNCSPRMARSIINQLADQDDIQIQGSKIGQKRCERELNIKRKSLENSANGGRKHHENEHERNKNNKVGSTPNPDPDPDSNPNPENRAFSKKGSRHGKKSWADAASDFIEEINQGGSVDRSGHNEAGDGSGSDLSDAKDVR